MKQLQEKEMTFRNYKVFIHADEKYPAILWVSKTNSKFRHRGWHSARITCREDAARWLNHIRSDINNRWRRKKERQAANRAAKEAFKNPYFVGQILRTSWGYDQTNVEFYQITEIGKMSIKIREINHDCKETSFMSGQTFPIPNSFCGEEHTQIIQVFPWGHTLSDHRGHGLYETSLKQINEGVYYSCYA